MWESLGKYLIEELQIHPRLVIIMTLMAAGVFGASLAMFVQTTAFEEHLDDYRDYKQHVDRRLAAEGRAIQTLTTTIIRNGLEEELRDTEKELFTLQRRERKGEADLDDLDRLDRLRTQERVLKQKIEELNHRNNGML